MNLYEFKNYITQVFFMAVFTMQEWIKQMKKKTENFLNKSDG